MIAGTIARNHAEPNGFTLVETLVAFAILAISMVALLQSFATGLQSLGISEAYAIATMHARSKLAEFGKTIPLEASEESGELDDRFEWRAVVADYDPGDTAGRVLGKAIKIYSLTVTVTWDNNREVTLTTLRVAPEDEP